MEELKNKIKQYVLNWITAYADAETDVEEDILNSKLWEISLDSLDAIDLLIEIDEEFELDIGHPESLTNESTVKDLLDYVYGELR